MHSDKETSSDLAAVISARICHDLVSPVGAVVNGIDLIREIGAGGLDDEFGMISQSAERASGLLQFYRLAFGTAAADGERIARDALIARTEGMITTPRITVNWQAAIDGPPLARPEARLLCQLLLCVRAIAGMSGMIEVSLDRADTFPMAVTLNGDGATDAAERLELLASDHVDVTPRSIEFAMARASSKAMGRQISVQRAPSRTTISVA
ncbi:MAG: histidine phosphotransferase family protein [Pseudomonadota bacterium]